MLDCGGIREGRVKKVGGQGSWKLSGNQSQMLERGRGSGVGLVGKMLIMALIPGSERAEGQET